MSLDIWLTIDSPVKQQGTGVYVRENGAQRELTQKEVAEKWPGALVPLQEFGTNEVYSANITHNLNKMAAAADLYTALWRPDEQGWLTAKDITGVLERGLKRLKEKPDEFKKFNPENGWGSYDSLVEFVENYLAACRKYPNATIGVSR